MYFDIKTAGLMVAFAGLIGLGILGCYIFRILRDFYKTVNTVKCIVEDNKESIDKTIKLTPVIVEKINGLTKRGGDSAVSEEHTAISEYLPLIIDAVNIGRKFMKNKEK